MLRQILLLVALATVSAGGVIATVFGSVRGGVHDPQHRPMNGAHVSLQANNSAYKQEADTNAAGVFEFQAVPLGEYSVTVQAQGFVDQSQTLLVVSGSAPVLHYAMALSSTAEKVTVTASPEDLNPDAPRRDVFVDQRKCRSTREWTPATALRSSQNLCRVPTWFTTSCTCAAGTR